MTDFIAILKLIIWHWQGINSEYISMIYNRFAFLASIISHCRLCAVYRWCSYAKWETSFYALITRQKKRLRSKLFVLRLVGSAHVDLGKFLSWNFFYVFFVSKEESSFLAYVDGWNVYRKTRSLIFLENLKWFWRFNNDWYFCCYFSRELQWLN